MNRYKITVEYDGTNFFGWQYQENGISVQQVLEEAITKFSHEVSRIHGAGRTDAGVHALNQVAHFDLNKGFETRSVQSALNHFVRPHLISIKEVELVDENFHARFSAKSRSYIYKILNRVAQPALEENKVWHISSPLNVEYMNEAAQYLIGKHDLSSFRASECQAKSPIKTISQVKVSKTNDEIIEMFIEAPSFLHNQVRITVGTLVKIGQEKWSKDKMKEIILAKNRAVAGQTAPANGLYLYKVQY